MQSKHPTGKREYIIYITTTNRNALVCKKETPLRTQIIEIDNLKETILSWRKLELPLTVQHVANTLHLIVFSHKI